MKKTNSIMFTKTMRKTSKLVMKRAWEIKAEDNRNVWSLCLKMTWEELKGGVLVSCKKGKKPANVSKEVESIGKYLDKAKKDNLGRDVIIHTLVGFNRKSLITVMKELKVKCWYRIYDKTMMATQVANLVVA